MASSEREFIDDQRAAERQTRTVSTLVQVRVSPDEVWKEISIVETVSKNGAALMLSRACSVGRLVSLAMQMPRDLRVYDHGEDVYPILGVVQNCHEILVNDKVVYHVGVAFIGKRVPASFRKDHDQSYRISGTTPDGLWAITEAESRFLTRKYSRFWIRIELGLVIRDHLTRTRRRCKVSTRDISAGGMSVWGPLEVTVGDRVKINSKEYN
ncbi:MAG: PilZ domain-containing protein, partial [Pyrinomonadaceae bacterium]